MTSLRKTRKVIEACNALPTKSMPATEYDQRGWLYSDGDEFTPLGPLLSQCEGLAAIYDLVHQAVDNET